MSYPGSECDRRPRKVLYRPAGSLRCQSCKAVLVQRNFSVGDLVRSHTDCSDSVAMPYEGVLEADKGAGWFEMTAPPKFWHPTLSVHEQELEFLRDRANGETNA